MQALLETLVTETEDQGRKMAKETLAASVEHRDQQHSDVLAVPQTVHDSMHLPLR